MNPLFPQTTSILQEISIIEKKYYGELEDIVNTD